MKFAAIFPGQGSQSVGMLAGLETNPVVEQLLAQASETLGYDLAGLVRNGPAERLNDTERAQPALLVAGVAAWRVWQAHGGPDAGCMAGHSLGEYTALVCAGSLDFATAVKLVEYRGKVMQEAVPAGAGAMVAVLGLTNEAVRDACAEAAQGEVVTAANFNAPGQVVISGEASAVRRATEACTQRGAKRVIPLPVSVPSHCELMRPAADKLSNYLGNINFHAPSPGVIHNVDVDVHTDAAQIREVLTEQLYGPVRWVETVTSVAGRGISHFVEFGPGRVLAGLVRRIDKNLAAYPVYDSTSLEAALAAVRAP